MNIDHWVAALLVPLAIWVLLNGLDDLFIDFAALFGYLRQRFSPARPGRRPKNNSTPPRPPDGRLRGSVERAQVIRKMIENNVTKLRYRALRVLYRRLPQRRAHPRRHPRGHGEFPQRSPLRLPP